MYQADKKSGDLSELQKQWVIGIPANQARFQMTSGFNRKFGNPENLQLSDFSKSCFSVFNYVKTPEERLRMWLNVGTLLFCDTKENVDLNQHPFDCDLAQLHDDMVQSAIGETLSRKLRCVKYLLEGGDPSQALSYIEGELGDIASRGNARR